LDVGLINPLSPEFQANPYPTYKRLLDEAPVYWSPLGYTFLSRYEDIRTLLRSSRAVIGYMHRVDMFEPGGPLQGMLGRWLLSIDDPDHKRIRRLASAGFTPKRIAAMEPRVVELVNGLLDDLEDADEIELIDDVAARLPSLVACEMLGVPPADRGDCIEWTRWIATSIDIIRTPEMIARAERAAEGFDEYLRALIGARRNEPRDDLVSALASVESEGERLSEDELVANLVLLFGAGHHTTSGLLGNAITALVERPEQMRWMRTHLDEMEAMVEELLRFDSPVQMCTRVLTGDVELSDETLPTGTRLAILLGAGNHDPEVFEQPDELDLMRRDVRPLSFSVGGHYCLGAPLGRLEGRTTLNALLERTSSIEFATDGPEWAPTCTLRGPARLELAVRWR
jgi:cytochrome P450